MNKIKIKKGDKVFVTTGRDKRKTGIVIKILRERRMAIVDGINMRKKYIKPGSSKDQQGKIVDIAVPIHISNLSLVDDKGNPVKIKYKLTDNQKERLLVPRKITI